MLLLFLFGCSFQCGALHRLVTASLHHHTLDLVSASLLHHGLVLLAAAPLLLGLVNFCFALYHHGLVLSIVSLHLLGLGLITACLHHHGLVLMAASLHHHGLILWTASLLHQGPVLINAALPLLGILLITVSLHLHGVVLCPASRHDFIAAPPLPWPPASLASGRHLPLDGPVRGLGLLLLAPPRTILPWVSGPFSPDDPVLGVVAAPSRSSLDDPVRCVSRRLSLDDLARGGCGSF